ncbi:MAG: chromophore lyase [Flavobacteriales bacterium]|nr:MAG: chromophore lyase [Flavobacteriales bacterium]
MKKIILLLTIMLSVFSYAQSDCDENALSVCGDSPISYTPTGNGDVEEDLGGCLSTDEHFSVWYSFAVEESGTLTFVIDPNANDDYDWAVYGPNVTCANLGEPIRCSYAAGGDDTGLNMTATDVTEGAGGDRWLKYLDVQEGETYYLIVDNFSTSDDGFVLTWGGTATLGSPFNDETQPNPFLPPGGEPGEPGDGVVTICTDSQLYDFTQLSEGILNGNPNFEITYHLTQNDALTGENPVEQVQVNTNDTYYYSIRYIDPADPNNPLSRCRELGEITFIQGNIEVNNQTLTSCNNNNSGVAMFNLDEANVFNANNATKQYYPTMGDLNAGTNEIQTPQIYESSEGTIYVKVTSEHGCENVAEVTLQFLPTVEVQDNEVTTCFVPTASTTGVFNLTDVQVVQNAQGTTMEYYASEQDAIDSNNPIANPAEYTSVATDVFVKVINQDGCYNVAKVTLNVTPPTYSQVLKDQIVCVENVAELDAGQGFDAYTWSTGDNTPSIQDVTVGSYWVDLTKNGCVTRQEVKVIASPTPVITDVKVKHNTMEVIVAGGTPPYQYSLNGVDWQESNSFENLQRGVNDVFVRDAYECEPVKLPVMVPNLLNSMSPNGDGLNENIDYSDLATYKNFNFSVYDRYENKIFQSTPNNYIWNGTYKGGKKVPTGTYWYTISWVSPTTKTVFSYKGWIVIKNR